MSATLNVINTINAGVSTYAPAVLAGVQAAEVSNAAGADKKQAVVNAVIATSGALTSSANPDVAGISALVDLTVSVLNALGVFTHKSTPAPVTPVTAVVA